MKFDALFKSMHLSGREAVREVHCLFEEGGGD
jgi:hypothetical protein